ncbi:MAG: hypothetical protein M1549_01140 [Candidatus Dependentiae bacterium]|nr:hypothetical protein [Candidatus Dependentiae bacterium]
MQTKKIVSLFFIALLAVVPQVVWGMEKNEKTPLQEIFTEVHKLYLRDATICWYFYLKENGKISFFAERDKDFPNKLRLCKNGTTRVVSSRSC